jgi:uncharacterized membrane protein
MFTGGVAPEAAAQREELDATTFGNSADGHTNVGSWERVASGFAGAMLACVGLRRRSLSGFALAAIGGSLLYRAATGHCSLYGKLGVSTAKGDGYGVSGGIKVEKSLIINRPAGELYDFWRKLENLPKFMTHLKSVRTLGDNYSHWVAQGPAGIDVEWGAEIINDAPGEVIAWQSLPESDVRSAGSVRFEENPDGGGTLVKVVLQYLPIGGHLGAALANMFAESPEAAIEQELKRFKQLMEKGAIYEDAAAGVCC